MIIIKNYIRPQSCTCIHAAVTYFQKGSRTPLNIIRKTYYFNNMHDKILEILFIANTRSAKPLNFVTLAHAGNGCDGLFI